LANADHTSRELHEAYQFVLEMREKKRKHKQGLSSTNLKAHVKIGFIDIGFTVIIRLQQELDLGLSLAIGIRPH
jgi:glutamine synthetase adenylyltransferase